MKQETAARLTDAIEPAYIEEFFATEDALRARTKHTRGKWGRLIPIAAALAGMLMLGGAFLLPALRKGPSPDLPPVGTESDLPSVGTESTGESASADTTEAVPETELPPHETTPGTVPETEKQPTVSPEILYEVFSLFTINDLKTYFSNGFTDMSLYEIPPVLLAGNAFPSVPFEGYFVDLYELFPGLNPDAIITEKIYFEFYPGKHDYEYFCRTSDGKGDFRVRVTYRKNIGNRTEEEIAAAYSDFIDRGHEVVFEDYTKTKYKPHTWRGIVYIGMGDGYATVYEVWDGNVTAVSIRAGDLAIAIFPGNYGYLAHDDLRAIACLRTDSPERDETLKRIAAYCQALQKEYA